jgi:hypothetical protein
MLRILAYICSIAKLRKIICDFHKAVYNLPHRLLTHIYPRLKSALDFYSSAPMGEGSYLIYILVLHQELKMDNLIAIY